jgi:hypothetical protein
VAALSWSFQRTIHLPPEPCQRPALATLWRGLVTPIDSASTAQILALLSMMDGGYPSLVDEVALQGHSRGREIPLEKILT